jgi:hypothetical protein
MEQLIKHHDIIQVFHSPIHLAPIMERSKKPVIVYHTGTGYRQTPEKIHAAYDGWVKKHVCALPELYEAFKSRSAEPCVYMVGGVKIPNAIHYGSGQDLIVGHYPSNPEVKGTERVAEVFQSLLSDGIPLLFDIQTNILPYSQQLKRINGCDIYVEMLAGMQGEKEYGSFGITALEAAARGKIVITNCKQAEPYAKHYGAFPFFIANTAEELKQVLTHLSALTSDEIWQLKHAYHDLLKDMHGHKTTGQYIVNNILNGLL